VPVLDWLRAQSDLEIVAVVTQPARPAGRGRNLIDPPVATAARAAGIPVLQPESARAEEFLAQLSQLKPDLAITAAYGQILDNRFLAIPTRATINIHPSLLPRYRGATPVQSAILDGCTESGVTILFTIRALDAGNIISQKSFAVPEAETAESFMTRMFAEGAALLGDALTKLKDPLFTGFPQDPTLVTHCKKIAKTDGQVDWSLNARELVNRFRAFSPWPGIYTFFESKRLTIRNVTGYLQQKSSPKPGAMRFDSTRNSLAVQCGDGEIYIDRLQFEGKKETDGRSFWNGLKNKDGILENA
jgi:methionyl-tRNA formyltransferase